MTAPARGGFILIGRFVAITALNYLFAFVLAWLLIPAEFGKVAVLQAILWLAAMVLNSGFPWTLAASVANKERLGRDAVEAIFRTSLLGNLAFGVVLALALVTAYGAGALRLGSDFGLLVGVAAVTFPFFALNSVARGALHGATRFGGLGLVQTVDVCVKCALGLSLIALAGIGIEAVAFAFLAGSLVATALATWFLRDLSPKRGPLAPLATYTSTLPMFVGVTAFALLLTADILTLGRLGAGAGVTASTIALYQAGAILARAPYFVGDALMDAVFPYMAQRQDSAVRSHGYFASATRWVVLAVVPLNVILIASPEPFLELFFPTSYTAAAPLLRLLALGSIGALAAGLFAKALQAVGQRGAAAKGALAALAVELALLAVLVPWIGAEGAAIAFAAGAWTGALLLALQYYRHQRVPLARRGTVARYGFALAALIVLAAPAGAAGSPSAPSVLLGLVAALAAYGATVLALGLVAAAELRRLALIGLDLAGVGRMTRGIGRARGRLATAGAWLADRPKVAVALLVLVAFLVISDNLARSPDTLYDEVVYTEAARNVATEGRLAWNEKPVFVHPPLYFLLQGAWLEITGAADGGLFEALHSARLLTAALSALSVGLTALFVFELTPAASRRRRYLLAVAAALLALFDPVLLRYGRVAMIEPAALFVSLLALYVAWTWRRRSAATWVPVVGLVSGLALLVKEISIFLLVVPLLAWTLRRDWPLARRAAGALAMGIALWGTFAAWSAALGLSGRFVEEKLLTFERLLGILQTTGWNRSTVSFVDALRVSAPQYLSSYLLLAAGAGALAWLWLRRNDEVGTFLVAWLLATLGFGAYIIARGQLNEQFFAYLIPGAAIGTVLAADALLVWAAGRTGPPGDRLRRTWRLAAAVPVTAVLALVVFGAANWWRLYHVGNDRGIEQISTFVASLGPQCSAFNASGDVEKYAFSITGHPVTSFGSGPLAASRGVRYFFFSPKDVWARYGKMNPDLEAWLRRSGRRVVSYPSHTYWGVELWRVDPWPFDPIADIQPVPGGVFVNVRGSGCGGYSVVDSPAGAFVAGYQALGGKPILGRPLSRTWKAEGRTLQAFDTVVLGSSPGAGAGARPPVRPVKVVAMLAKTRPDLLALRGLHSAISAPGGQPRSTLALLTDPLIARRYVGGDPARADADDWKRARERWGAPLAPAHRFARGFVRQSFERVVFERRIGDPRYGVRLARRLGEAVIESGFIPASARRTLPVPNLEQPEPPPLPSRIRPFLFLFGSALAAIAFLFLGVTVGSRAAAPTTVRARSTDRPRAEAAPNEIPERVFLTPPPGDDGGPPGDGRGRVRVNSATVEDLNSLPGVGVATAERILAYRETHGAFRSVAELARVPGIGPARLAQLRGLVDLE